MKRGAQTILLIGGVVAALGFAPAAFAGVQVGFGFNVTLPPGVHISVSNFEPYYVGRVFYEPAAVWRPVYSFPVETAYGVVYRPYVYDGGRPVCNGYMLGPGYGYSSLVVDGRGYFQPQWYHGPYSRSGYSYNEHRYSGRGYDDHDSHHKQNGHNGHGNKDHGNKDHGNKGHGNNGHGNNGHRNNGHR
jgi:hypothetical protein